MADARHLPHGRSRAGDRHLNFYETRDNLAMRALLAGEDIRSHMEDYRLDHVCRFDRVQSTGDIDTLFVEAER